MKKFIWIFAALSLLSGCATSNNTFSSHKGQLISPSNNSGKYREINNENEIIIYSCTDEQGNNPKPVIKIKLTN